MRLITAALLSFACVFPLLAQEKIVESIEVRVVNVDVVVTDAHGKPVTGLTKADFELFENGKKQPVTNLYEVRPEASADVVPAVATSVTTATRAQAEPAAPMPQELRVRRILMFVDNYSLHPFQRNNVLKSLDGFIDKHMGPNDEAALVSWSNNTQVITPFTSDKAALKAGIKTLEDRTRAAMSIDSQVDQVKKEAMAWYNEAKEGQMTGRPTLSYQDAYNLSKGAVDQYAAETTSNVQKILESMRQMMSSLAGVEGKKVMVFAGAHLPERPGADLYYWLNGLYNNNIKNLSPLAGVMESAHNAQTFSIEKLAKQANANGVTMYIIDAADQRNSKGADQAMEVDQTEEFMSFTNTAMAYQTLARITGGVLVANSQNFDVAFEAVAHDLNAYYSIGYKPASDQGGDKKIVVKTINPTYRVRFRQTYTPKTPEDDINDKVLANIYHGGMKGEWPVEVHPGELVKDGDKFKLPIEIIMSSRAVTLIPQGDQLVGGFDVYMMVGNDNGGTSRLTKSPQKISIPVAAEKELRGGPLSFKAMIMLRPGPATLSIAVVDQISNVIGFAKARVVAE